MFYLARYYALTVPAAEYTLCEYASTSARFDQALHQRPYPPRQLSINHAIYPLCTRARKLFFTATAGLVAVQMGSYTAI